jgi:hypothetical protein
VSRVYWVTQDGVTHGDVTDDVWEPSGRFDGKNEVTPVIRMFVTRNGATVSRARNTASFGEVYDTIDNEVVSTSPTGANPTWTGELVMSMRVEFFVASARGGRVRKSRLRETKEVVNEDDEMIALKGIVNLGAGNDSDPRVGRGTKFSLVTFEDGFKNWGMATSGLLRVSKSLGMGEMLDARNVIRGCSFEGLWRHEVWMIWLD